MWYKHKIYFYYPCTIPALDNINTATFNKQTTSHKQHIFHNLIKHLTFKMFQLLMKSVKCYKSQKKKKTVPNLAHSLDLDGIFMLTNKFSSSLVSFRSKPENLKKKMCLTQAIIEELK